MISCGHLESGPGALTPSFVFWRVAANLAAVKPPEILSGVAVDVLQQSDTTFDTNRVDSRSASLFFVSEELSFLTLAGMGQ